MGSIIHSITMGSRNSKQSMRKTSHQAYMHKILRGWRSKMGSIRRTFGLVGFPKRDESAHDAFGAGHSSTSISAGLGMAVARYLLGKDNYVMLVIGDGAMIAGQAYEALYFCCF